MHVANWERPEARIEIGCKAQAWYEFRKWAVSFRGALWRKGLSIAERQELWGEFLEMQFNCGRITAEQWQSWLRVVGR